jgi:hypothetical protein
MFIDGSWTEARSGRTSDAFDPATGDAIGDVPNERGGRRHRCDRGRRRRVRLVLDDDRVTRATGVLDDDRVTRATGGCLASSLT